MRKLSFVFLLGGLLSQAYPTLAQQATKPVYLQIFYEGSSQLSGGSRVLSYSPSFRGKTHEILPQSDSAHILDAKLRKDLAGNNAKPNYTTVYPGNGKGYITTADGKTRLLTADDIRQREQEQNASVRTYERLQQANAAASRDIMTQAINEAAADGWEVVQMTTWGTQGGLVYLLRRR
ncbi:MAG: hypothetical protein ACRYG7_36365 [Janthinobacterium lividum]